MTLSCELRNGLVNLRFAYRSHHDVVERVRRAIYDTFARQGHAPSRQQIRDLPGSVEIVRGFGFRRLPTAAR